MYPTPAARDIKGRDRPERQGGQGLESSLVEPAEARTGIPRAERLLLEQQRSETSGALYSTPTASNGGEAKSMGYSNSPKWKSAATLADQLRTTPMFCLNPPWVEHLMGFPPGWTDSPVWKAITLTQREQLAAFLCLTPAAWDALLAGGGRRAAGKSSTRGKSRASSHDPAEEPTGGPG